MDWFGIGLLAFFVVAYALIMVDFWRSHRRWERRQDAIWDDLRRGRGSS